MSAKLEKFLTAFELQRKDDGLRVLMRYALAVGNYLNGQSTRGGCSGFKLDILSKLDDIRSNDPKWNFMMYLIDWVESFTKKDICDDECKEKYLYNNFISAYLNKL